jgi:hypothetical protein
MKNDMVTHPSYGLLSIHRVQGGDQTLFGSSLLHQNRLSIKIHEASFHRDLNHTWYSDDTEIIEIEMSPAQFAEAITTPNMGIGTPCTIRRLHGKRVADCPHNDERRQVLDEFKEDMQKLAAEVDKLRVNAATILEKKNITKGDREALLGIFSKLECQIGSNIPFVHESFHEATDKTVTQAKLEIEAFYTSAMMSAGREALMNKAPKPDMKMLEEHTVGADTNRT